MQPKPIEPSWVLAGNPQARLSLHSRAYDDQATTAIWDCTAGTFRWYFGWDETVMILEGEVHITAEDGSERTLKAGDIAVFSDHLVMALGNGEVYVSGQVQTLASISSGPDFPVWIDPTAQNAVEPGK